MDNNEFLLDPKNWPAMPQPHKDYLQRALSLFRPDPRFLGLGAGGSLITGGVDEYSDLDLLIITKPEFSNELLSSASSIASQLGSLLSSFSGEHVGDTRLLICLYGSPLLHVDLKFVMPMELLDRVENPLLFWD